MKKISIVLFLLLGFGLLGTVYGIILPLEQVSGYYLRDMEGDNAALQGSRIALGMKNGVFGVLSNLTNGKVENRYAQYSIFEEEAARIFPDLSVDLEAALQADSDIKITVERLIDPNEMDMENVQVKTTFTNAGVQLMTNRFWGGNHRRSNREGFLRVDTGLTLKSGTNESRMGWSADLSHDPAQAESQKHSIASSASYNLSLGTRTNWQNSTRGATLGDIDYITPLGNLGNMTGKTAIYRIDALALVYGEDVPVKTVDGYPLVRRSEVGNATAIAELDITDKNAYVYALFPYGENLLLVVSLDGKLWFQLYSTKGDLLDTLAAEDYFKDMAALGAGTAISSQNQEGVVQIIFQSENKDSKQTETQVLLLDSSVSQLKPLFSTTLVGKDVVSLVLEDRVIFGLFRDGIEFVASDGFNRVSPPIFHIEVYGLEGDLLYHGEMNTDNPEEYRRFLYREADYQAMRWPRVFKMEVYHAGA